MIEGAEILAPLLLGARSGEHRRYQPVVEHPVECELACRHAALFGVGFDALRMCQRLFAKLGFQHAPVAAPGACIACRLAAGQVLSREHAARERAVRHYAHAIVCARRKHLDFAAAVHRVVDRL